jgi:hypothetical protein
MINMYFDVYDKKKGAKLAIATHDQEIYEYLFKNHTKKQLQSVEFQ